MSHTSCHNCHTDNPSGAKFCMGCGSPMARRCGTCSSELPAQAKFCLECGTPVARAAPTPRPAGVDGPPSIDRRLERYIPKQLLARLTSARSGGGMRGERRIVTMLFCDVKGSTAAAEKLDPEEWADIMNGAFEHLIAPVYRYEGTLARLMGDAILAFFGAPIAHEDDPQRAILAGLAIVSEIEGYRQQVKRRWGIDFDVRVGINTGLVVVGEVGTDMRLEYTAMGDAVNLAARMEQAATPGTVLVASDTHKLVAPLFDFEQREGIELKGKATPVTAYRVVGPKAKPGRLRGIEGLDAPMIGRDHELAALRGALDAARRGSGQVVSVMAEAGLGKSRLVGELLRLAEGEGALAELDWLEGRALSFQSQSPLAPFADLFARSFDLDGATEDGERLSRLKTALDGVAPDATAELLPCFGSLLGIPLPGEIGKRLEYLEPPALRRLLHDAILRFLEAKAALRPVVLVLEDLHWADSSSLELAERLMALSEQSLLLILVFRPRRDEASWKLHEVAGREYSHRYLELSLQPLSPERSRELVQNLLWIEGLPEALRRLIVDKCDGNPFFVEEVIRSLIDAGLVVREEDHWRATREIDSLKVPDTLAGVLTTRLDGLGETPKRVAQTAAVLGREVEWDLLASIFEPYDALGEAAAELQRKGILREKSRLPRRILEFKHALTREAAYDSMLLKTRRELHGKVAAALERVAPERVDDVATHYLEARENALALPWVVRAGDRAAKAYATPEALRWYGRALEILRVAPDHALSRHVFEARGTALSLAMKTDEAMENYDAMRALGDADGDREMVASALNKKATVRLMQVGDVEGALGLLDEAEAIAEGASANVCLAEGSMIRCNIYTSRAEFGNAYRFLDRAARLGAELQDEEPLLFGLVHICNTLVYMTEYDRAWEKAQEAAALAEERGNLKWLSELKTFAEPSCLSARGDIEGALASLSRGVEVAERIGHFGSAAVGYALEGQLRTLRGEFGRAIECNEHAVASATRSQVPFFQSWALCVMGTTYLQVSEKLHAMALEKHDRAMEIMRSPWGNVLGAMNWCELGYCCLEFGKDEEALGLFQRGLTEPSPPMQVVKPQLHVGAAFVHVRRGDLGEARRHAREAQAFADARGMRHYGPLLFVADAAVARAEGDTDRALAALDDAARAAESLGFRPAQWQALAQAGTLLEELGRADEANAHRARGAAIVRQICDDLEDGALAALYAERAGQTLGVNVAS